MKLVVPFFSFFFCRKVWLPPHKILRIENIAISCTVLTYQQHSNLMFYHNGTTLPCFKTLSENVDLVNNTSKQIMSKMLTLSLRTRIIKYCDENSKVFCLLCSTICLLALGIKTERHFFLYLLGKCLYWILKSWIKLFFHDLHLKNKF